MTVYDCTMFHWEFDMLELRIKELWDEVDYFCVTESKYDHRGNKRELSLSDNLSKFDWAKEKLVVNVSDKPEVTNSTWDYERHQRLESLASPLRKFDVKAEDLFIISDMDEIVRPEAIKVMRGKEGLFTLQMPMYYYYVNLYITEWFFPRAVTPNFFQNPNILRQSHPQTSTLIQNAGWHFSYLGDADEILHKLKTFAHDEFDVPEITNINHVLDAIKNKKDLFGRKELVEFGPGGFAKHQPFEILNIDESWPKTITKNIDKYQKYVAN